MAAGRSAIFEGLFGTLLADPALVPGILGPRTVKNQRLYRSFPQEQPLLSEYEPVGGEGWLILEEMEPGPRLSVEQSETIYEVIEIAFHLFGNRYAIGDAVSDILDMYWHWTVDQQRNIQYGDRILLFTRRRESSDKYAQGVKLHQKTIKYMMRFIPEVLYV